jgi:ligand-binding sensor domain-containing protein
MKNNFIFYLLFLFITTPIFSQVVHQKDFDRFSIYRIGDWISYGPANEITSIDIGQLYAYIGTRKGGILRYDLFSGKWKYPYTTASGLRSNYIFRIVYDYNEDKIYALTPKGIDEYNESFNYWEPSNRESLPPRRTPTIEDIKNFRSRGGYDFPAFYRPNNSELPDFFMNRDYIYRIDGEILDRENQLFKVTDRVADQFRRIWVGTNGIGIGIGDMNTLNLTIIRRSIPDVDLRDILFDGENLWAGGIGKPVNQSGIGFWNRKKDIWFYHRAGYNLDIHNDNIHVIEAFNGNIYFGSDGGLLVYNKDKKLWKTLSQHDGLQSEIITDLYTFKNKLFIGTETGFNWIDNSGTVKSPTNKILTGLKIYKITSNDSLILLATNSGVYTYSPENYAISHFEVRASLPDHHISALKQYKNELWIAGQTGIISYNKKTKEWGSYPEIRQYIKGEIRDICFTKGHIWFATQNGLLEYDRSSDYWYLYTKRDGLAANNIFHIDKYKNKLWLSTSKGIVIFRHKRLEKLEE